MLKTTIGSVGREQQLRLELENRFIKVPPCLFKMCNVNLKVAPVLLVFAHQHFCGIASLPLTEARDGGLSPITLQDKHYPTHQNLTQ